VVGDHQCGAVSTQEPVDRLREPALVTELEAVAAGWQQRKRAAEAIVVALEVRGKLPDDRPKLARLDERLDALVVAPYALSEILEALDVRQVAACLGGEDEVGRRLLDPSCDGLG